MTHLRALWVTALGIIVLSPDSTLVRLVNADIPTTIVCRGAAIALGATILMLARGGSGNPAGAMRQPAFWALTGCFGLANSLFVVAIKTAPIADTLGSMATTSIFAAAFSFVFLGERLGRRLIVATVVIGASLFLITLYGGGQLYGRLMGLAAAAMFGAIFVAMRAPSNRDPLPAIAISGSVLAVCFLFASDTSTLHIGGGIATLGLAIAIPGAMGLVAIGTRRLVAPEVGLIALLETLFGTFWAWLFLGEIPELITGVAVLIILATLGVFYANEFRLSRRYSNRLS